MRAVAIMDGLLAKSINHCFVFEDTKKTNTPMKKKTYFFERAALKIDNVAKH
jgi:hypothetical protein